MKNLQYVLLDCIILYNRMCFCLAVFLQILVDIGKCFCTTAVLQHPRLYNARDLFQMVAQLIRSEGEITEVVISALGLANPAAFLYDNFKASSLSVSVSVSLSFSFSFSFFLST